nr:hypothetical protein [Escherichia coli]
MNTVLTSRLPQNRSPAPVFVVMSGEYLLDKKEEIIQ